MANKYMLGDVFRKVLHRPVRHIVGVAALEFIQRYPHLGVAYSYFLFGLRLRIAPNEMFLGKANGLMIAFPRNELPTFIELYHDNVYEQELHVSQGDTVVDVGAHIGLFTIRAASETGTKGMVVAIEPEPRNLELLRQNIESNGLRNVVIVDKAASSKHGKATLYLGASSGRHSLITPSNSQIEVEVDTLDNIRSELDLSHVDYIKIDTEGAELEVLKGAESILNQDGLKLSIAAYHLLPDGAREFERIADYLRQRGFQLRERDKSYIYAFKPAKSQTNRIAKGRAPFEHLHLIL